MKNNFKIRKADIKDLEHILRLNHELFKEEFKDAHRAKPDVEALIRCYGELFNRGVV